MPDKDLAAAPATGQRLPLLTDREIAAARLLREHIAEMDAARRVIDAIAELRDARKPRNAKHKW